MTCLHIFCFVSLHCDLFQTHEPSPEPLVLHRCSEVQQWSWCQMHSVFQILWTEWAVAHCHFMLLLGVCRSGELETVLQVLVWLFFFMPRPLTGRWSVHRWPLYWSSACWAGHSVPSVLESRWMGLTRIQQYCANRKCVNLHKGHKQSNGCTSMSNWNTYKM